MKKRRERRVGRSKQTRVKKRRKRRVGRSKRTKVKRRRRREQADKEREEQEEVRGAGGKGEEQVVGRIRKRRGGA